MKRYIKATTDPVEVFNTGGNTYFAEMDLGDGTYAVVSNAYEDELAIYKYPESGLEDDKYYAEDMIYDEEVADMDSAHLRIYKKLYKALHSYGIV